MLLKTTVLTPHAAVRFLSRDNRRLLSHFLDQLMRMSPVDPYNIQADSDD